MKSKSIPGPKPAKTKTFDQYFQRPLHQIRLTVAQCCTYEMSEVHGKCGLFVFSCALAIRERFDWSEGSLYNAPKSHSITLLKSMRQQFWYEPVNPRFLAWAIQFPSPQPSSPHWQDSSAEGWEKDSTFTVKYSNYSKLTLNQHENKSRAPQR